MFWVYIIAKRRYDVNNMDIQKLAEDISKLERELSDLTDVVGDRWRKMRGDNYRIFEAWWLEGENVVVRFSYRGDNDFDQESIPVRFFTEDDEAKALREWEEERGRLEKAKYQAEIQRRERNEREMLETLKKKYDVS